MAKAKKAQIVDPSEVLTNNTDDLKKYIRLGVAAVVIAVVASVGIGIVQKQNQKEIEEQASLVFEFKEGALKNFEDKKIQEDEFIKSAQETVSKLKDTASFFPVASVVFTKIRENKLPMEKLAPLFKDLRSGTNNKNLAYYYFSNYLAVIQEDGKKYEDALTTLKGLVDSPYKYEEKLYLDLGRLNYLIENKAVALSNFKHVVDKFPDTEMAKMAKRYIYKYDLETNEETKSDAN